MAVAVDAIEQLHAEVEELGQRSDLSDAERDAAFRLLRDRLSEAMGLLTRYERDARVAEMGRQIEEQRALDVMYANARLRETLLDRGMATAEELDDLGYFANEDLARMAEEGLLEEAVATFAGAVEWDEKLHPRDRAGKFREIVGNWLKANLRSPKPPPEPLTSPHPKRAKAKPKPAPSPPKPKVDDPFEARKKALEERTREKAAQGLQRVRLTDAETHFNEAGQVSQRGFATYVNEAATRPQTVDLYSTVDAEGNRVWDESRRELHEQIIDMFLRQRVFDPEADGGKGAWLLSSESPRLPSSDAPEVLFSGGGYASGKSSVLKINRAQGGEPDSGYEGPVLVLDPDMVKAQLPEFNELLESDPEANMVVYQEAWEIAQEIQARAQERKLNMVVDGISNTSPDEMLARARSFFDRGYSAKAIYVDIPTDEALRRAAERARKAENPSDRRHIPEVIMRAVHRDVSATVPNLVKQIQAEGLDMEVEVWDNDQGQDADGSFRPPLRFFRFVDGEEIVEDQALWDRFVGKASETIPGVEPVGTEGPKAEPGGKPGVPQVAFRQTRDFAEFESAKAKNARVWNLSPKAEEEFARSRAYLSEDGKVGFVLTEDGDLQNVFNNSDVKGAGQAAVVHAVEQGARTLDAYDGFLPGYYARFGFREVVRQKFVDEFAPESWDFEKLGRPDVVHMAFQGGDRATLRERIGSFGHEPTMDYTEDWDEAKSRASQAASA